MRASDVVRVAATAALTLPLLLGAGAAGCASRASAVALSADPSTWRALAGQWRGTYASGHERAGSITLEIDAGEAHAYGTLLMLPDRTQRANTPLREPLAAPPETSRLSIRVARGRHLRVSGALDPYWDPMRDCLALSTFDGAVSGPHISGTFVSKCVEAGPTISGRWQVRRTMPLEGSRGRR